MFFCPTACVYSIPFGLFICIVKKKIEQEYVYARIAYMDMHTYICFGSTQKEKDPQIEMEHELNK